MKKVFWREKNADVFMDKAEIIIPSKEELFISIIDKLKEKIFMVDVIFDSDARNQYLKEKNKNIPEGTPLIVIQQKIGTRVIIDFLQLAMDLAALVNVSVNINSDDGVILNQDDIKQQLLVCINDLNSNKNENINKICSIALNLMNLLGLDYEKIEEQRKLIEEKEGNFYKGKYVILED